MPVSQSVGHIIKGVPNDQRGLISSVLLVHYRRPPCERGRLEKVLFSSTRHHLLRFALGNGASYRMRHTLWCCEFSQKPFGSPPFVTSTHPHLAGDYNRFSSLIVNEWNPRIQSRFHVSQKRIPLSRHISDNFRFPHVSSLAFLQ